MKRGLSMMRGNKFRMQIKLKCYFDLKIERRSGIDLIQLFYAFDNLNTALNIFSAISVNIYVYSQSRTNNI